MVEHKPSMASVLGAARERRERWRRIALVVAGAVLATTLLALVVGSLGGGSSGVSNDEGEASPASADSGAGYDAETEAPEPAAGSRDDAGSDGLAFSEGSAPAEDASVEQASVELPLTDRAVIRTGSLSLTSPDVDEARLDLLNAVTALGGYVADEQSRADDDGDLRAADIVVQVPTAEFGTAMQRFSTFGTVTGRTQSARDVTEQVVDVDTRVANAEASLRRIRLLLGRAVSLGDVIRLEQVLSSRQADLESLLAQQESLAAKTNMATVQVTIEVPPKDPPVVQEEKKEELSGFFDGLSRGWDALVTGYVRLATLLGIVLPTLVVLGALGLIGYWIARRFRRRPVSASAST
jgi:hypothetical protein